jgi:hypothetical protein
VGGAPHPDLGKVPPESRLSRKVVFPASGESPLQLAMRSGDPACDVVDGERRRVLGVDERGGLGLRRAEAADLLIADVDERRRSSDPGCATRSRGRACG